MSTKLSGEIVDIDVSVLAEIVDIDVYKLVLYFQG